MSGAVFAIAAVAWLVAAWAFVRVAMSWLGVMRLAPAGRKFTAALELAFWNFPAVLARVGHAAGPHIEAYRRGFLVFFGAVGTFMVLVLINVAIGNAA